MSKKTETEKRAKKATSQKQRDAQAKKAQKLPGRGGLLGASMAAARARQKAFNEL